MGGLGLVDVGLDNLDRCPGEVLEAIFWELELDDETVDARFHKEEWFSSTLLEWGACGKLLEEGGRAVAFAQFAPAPLFPRVATFPSGRVSEDAVYLAYCYVASGHRGKGLGTRLVRAVGRDVAGRGYRALESVGERDWSGGWVIPFAFLAANRFSVLREDPRFPLMRLDLWAAGGPREAAGAAAVGLPGDPRSA